MHVTLLATPAFLNDLFLFCVLLFLIAIVYWTCIITDAVLFLTDFRHVYFGVCVSDYAVILLSEENGDYLCLFMKTFFVYSIMSSFLHSVATINFNCVNL